MAPFVSIFLSDGEAEAIESLRRQLQGQHAALSIVTPRIGERYTLANATPPSGSARGRIEAQEAVACAGS